MFRNRDKPKEPGEPGAPGQPDQPSDEAAAHMDQASAQLEILKTELDETTNKWKRALADYQNFQRRSRENEREARRQGLTDVLQSIIPVLDHFDLALGHDLSTASAAQVVQGVEVIREELIKALGVHGVGIISPAVNEPLDPHRHQAITHLAAPGVEPGHISATLQVGYVLGDRVIRPAKVAVAPEAGGTAGAGRAPPPIPDDGAGPEI